MSRAIRVATIYHNDPDRRACLELLKESDGYVWYWRTESGEDCGLGTEDCGLGYHKTVYDAEIAALQTWSNDVWDFRATWRK